MIRFATILISLLIMNGCATNDFYMTGPVGANQSDFDKVMYECWNEHQQEYERDVMTYNQFFGFATKNKQVWSSVPCTPFVLCVKSKGYTTTNEETDIILSRKLRCQH